MSGLKGSDRILLKRLLKELESEGAIAGRSKLGFAKRGELPEMTVIEITGTDVDSAVGADRRRIGHYIGGFEFPPLLSVRAYRVEVAVPGTDVNDTVGAYRG